MFKISTQWTLDNENTIFTMFIEKDNQVYNCALDGKLSKNPYKFINHLKVMIESLYISAHPEMKDLLFKLRCQKENIEDDLKSINLQIEKLESK